MFANKSNDIIKRSLTLGSGMTFEKFVEVYRLTPGNRGRRNRFIILKDDHPNGTLPYYALRCQTDSVTAQLKDLQLKFKTTFTTVIDLFQPNAILFYNIIKQELSPHLQRAGQWFDLTNLTEAAFKLRILAIDARRTKTAQVGR